MRIAALYDIHGNISALEAVLKEVSEDEIDALVIGGDVVWGPHPRAALKCLNELDLPLTFIRGNTDRSVSRVISESSGGSGEEGEVAQVTDWCRHQLSERQLNWVRNQPLTASFVVEGLGETLFCHGSPRSDEEIITVATPEERFLDAMSGVHASTAVCGHTHMQFDRTVRNRRLINAGSVGMPYEGRRGAFWALFGPGVSFRRTDYNIEEAASEMRASGCPHVEEFFIDTILNPPGKDATVRHFEERAATESAMNDQ
ncbi:MAG: metallophosphatase family protein [Actinomycetota bacterium]|nr:metallophosphatase family protein [Actinomycetota bacterium]